MATNTYSQIKLWRLEDGHAEFLTSDRTNSFSPSFSPDGDWLYFLSDRNLRSLVGSPWGPRQPEPYFDHSTEIYQVALEAGLRPPFRPQDEMDETHSTEETPREAKAANAGQVNEGEEPAGDKGADSAAAANVEIDLVGLSGRLWKVPVPAGNYRSLSVNEKALFWISRDSGPNPKSHLHGIAIGNDAASSPEAIVSDVSSYLLSGDGSRVLVRQRDDLFVFDAKPGPQSDLQKHSVDLKGWTFPISVREDLRQIFIDAWRLERDYFYDPGMHGVDWEGVRDKYLPLVEAHHFADGSQ